MKYVIIQPYFGKFPEWIDLFFYSCGKNNNVDFVFFTDCELSQEQLTYSNIKFVKTTFEKYCELVSDRFPSTTFVQAVRFKTISWSNSL